MIALVVLGFALVALGALVLVRFPDRPGGEVRLLGLRVSSIGAGLPLVALGVLVSVVAATHRGGDGKPASTQSPGGGSGGVAGPPPDNTPACIAEFFQMTPKVSLRRQRTIAAGLDDVEVLAPEESKHEEFGLVLTDNREVLGAAKMSYDDAALRFRVDGIAAADCKPALWVASDEPGASPPSVGQFSNLRVTFGAKKYDIELKPNSTIMEIELHRIGQ
ncbi:MAG: hypothetical protein ACRDLS_06305 [Solirubrobacteraceae bacterium]